MSLADLHDAVGRDTLERRDLNQIPGAEHFSGHLVDSIGGDQLGGIGTNLGQRLNGAAGSCQSKILQVIPQTKQKGDQSGFRPFPNGKGGDNRNDHQQIFIQINSPQSPQRLQKNRPAGQHHRKAKAEHFGPFDHGQQPNRKGRGRRGQQTRSQLAVGMAMRMVMSLMRSMILRLWMGMCAVTSVVMSMRMVVTMGVIVVVMQRARAALWAFPHTPGGAR